VIEIKLPRNTAKRLQYYLSRSYLWDNDLDISNPVGLEAACGNGLALEAMESRRDALKILDDALKNGVH